MRSTLDTPIMIRIGFVGEFTEEPMNEKILFCIQVHRILWGLQEFVSKNFTVRPKKLEHCYLNYKSSEPASLPFMAEASLRGSLKVILKTLRDFRLPFKPTP